jgi:hypothetical protein
MGTRTPRSSPVITASEIGQYTYCSNAWYLHRCGYEPQSPALETGTQAHTALGDTMDDLQRRHRRATRVLAAGLILLFLGLLAYLIGVVP